MTLVCRAVATSGKGDRRRDHAERLEGRDQDLVLLHAHLLALDVIDRVDGGVAVDAAIAGRDEADQLQALLVEHAVVVLGEGVAAIERLEDVVVVAKDVGQLEDRHLGDQRRQGRRGDRPEVDGAELDLLGDLALAAERAGMVVGDLDLAAGQFRDLVGELLRGQRCAVLGRVDVAHAHFGLGPGRAGTGERCSENCQVGREPAQRAD